MDPSTLHHRMITPRSTRLIRVPDLHGFREVLAGLACGGDLFDVRSRVILMPTRTAASQLRHTIETLGFRERDASDPVLVLPDLLTREDLYERLRRSAMPAIRLLSDFEREVLFRAAARDAIEAGAEPPFRIRPGLVAEMLALYDALRRQHRTLDAFERSMTGALAPSADADRGAARMLSQTLFLVQAFRAYERRVAASGALDEHALRARLLEASFTTVRHVVVTTSDRAAEPDGLWLTDYDFLTRVAGLTQLDVVATEAMLATGYHERLRELLPEIEEVRSGSAGPIPRLMTPATAEDGICFVSRDREEELIAVTRRLKTRARTVESEADTTGGEAAIQPVSERTAIVFQRPLPYLYLARHVLGASGISYQTHDALPLAAEPFAAALDLLFAFVTSQFTRSPMIALLRSPHFAFRVDDELVDPASVVMLDRALYDAGYLGERQRLVQIAGRLDEAAAKEPTPARRRLARAARAAAGAAEMLSTLEGRGAPAQQVEALLAFIRAHERLPDPGDPGLERQFRARAAILAALERLREAQSHDPVAEGRFSDVVSSVRRWLESQTFAPRTGTQGVQLMDAQTARYADLDEAWIVGLVETEWPERPRRNIFYPPALLAPLGWSKELDRTTAARAAFSDLLGLPARRLGLSLFSLENEAIVNPSWLLEEVGRERLVDREDAAPAGRISIEDALLRDPVAASVLSPSAANWVALRAARTGHADPRFHGRAGTQSPGAFAVSAVERYLDCPFKYFAATVLRLQEERDDEGTLTPLARGKFIHEVFHEFFKVWSAAGQGAITQETIDSARDEFAAVIDRLLPRLPESDRALERVRLLGSAAAPGLGDRVFRMELERTTGVVERLLEYTLDGDVLLEVDARARRVRLRGTADRIDLLEDGTLRLIDYKTGRAPKSSRAVQLPIYGLAAQQRLAGYRGRHWDLGEAGYLAFGTRELFVPMRSRRSDMESTMAHGQRRFLEAVEGIEAGDYPPRPADPILCDYCAYSEVCRKDYVGDE